MIPLFLLAAALLLVSGLLKLRTAARAEIGVHLPSLGEVVAGVALPALALVGPGPGTGSLALGLAFLLLLGSSVHLTLRLRRRSRLRERTEGRRLESYVRYLSDQPDDPS